MVAGKTLRNLFYLVVIAELLSATTSCKSRVNREEPASKNQSAEEYVAQADQLYAQREDLMRLRQGIILLTQATVADPGSYAAQWRLAKFNYYLATHTDIAAERDEAFRRGITAGKAAVTLQDGKPDGHFWLGANYGGSAQTDTLAGLTTTDDILHEMETVLRLDEKYQNGSAYMVLGMVHLQAPMMLGGDPQKAVTEMERGLRFGNTNAFLHLHLAEAYLKVGRKADAHQQLKIVIEMKPDQDYLPEYKQAVLEAQQILDRST
jgi:tetratricopeptide (TPR) repeat protein